QPTLFGDGKKTRDYIYVGDVVRANLLALDGGGSGEVLNLGWGKETTDLEVFEAVRNALGVQRSPAYASKRPGELNRIALDSSRAKKLLGWKPQVPFEEGVRLAAEHYRKP
ncbi:MAG: GDP-mannose 4,6-dehydratase, partial [Candidatus Omnitrophica bacterium]|nr:GDP-mannose 4,6-dehydratase [Candidatus Omnitrophota bacterium]